MNERHFGAEPTTEGTSFRLWAPAAKRVDLRLEENSYPLQRGQDGWFSADIAGVEAGARYRFRIDDESMFPIRPRRFSPMTFPAPAR